MAIFSDNMLKVFIINVLKKPIFKTIRNAALFKPYNNLGPCMS